MDDYGRFYFLENSAYGRRGGDIGGMVGSIGLAVVGSVQVEDGDGAG